MARYRYRPLPGNGDGFLRLVTIHSAGYLDDDIVISLSPTTFAKGDAVPHYEALSYVWGSKKHRKTIYIGKSDRATLRITKNLYEALCELRYSEEDRVMWIDALCIDQANTDEKVRTILEIDEHFC